MKKEVIIVSISKKTGEILRAESHGVKGKACLELLERMFGNIMDVSDVELTTEYDEGENSYAGQEQSVEINLGDNQ
mgnify:CR=1 FL=1|tara:strand:+ start:528 stop:755 length:228 start_codon:yes stop_codon:yes gene_type:complete